MRSPAGATGTPIVASTTGRRAAGRAGAGGGGARRAERRWGIASLSTGTGAVRPTSGRLTSSVPADTNRRTGQMVQFVHRRGPGPSRRGGGRGTSARWGAVATPDDDLGGRGRGGPVQTRGPQRPAPRGEPGPRPHPG